MTRATTVLLAQLRGHIGTDATRRESLSTHIAKATGRPIERTMLWRYLNAKTEPGADVLIPMMRWMQLQGIITPTKKAVGLFAYSNPLKKTKTSVKTPGNRK